MFASLKNKIREETGTDLSKLTAKITSTTTQRIESLRGLSQHGSTSSINSIVSSESNQTNTKDDSSSHDDKKRTESKLDDKDWKEAFREKDRRIKNLEKEKEEAYKQINILKQSLKNSEDYKQKLVEHQEDKEQIDAFQIQELSKVKQLVLLRDQELAEKTQALKEANQQIQKHRAELSRLRKQEEQLSDVQDDLDSLRHSTSRDLATLAADLAKSEEQSHHLSDLVTVLRQIQDMEGDNTDDVVSSGRTTECRRGSSVERRLLEQRLEESSLQLVQIKVAWSEKITSLETQVGRLSRQVAAESAERRTAVDEKQTLQEQVRQLEAELECNKLEINNKDSKMRRLISEIEEMSTVLKTLKAESDEQIKFLRNQVTNAGTEIKAIRKNLENTESELEKNDDECGKLRQCIDSEHETNISLRTVITRLEKELNDERSNSLNVQRTLSRVTTEKNTALLRNAEISQQMEIVKQDTRRQDNEMNDLINKIAHLENENATYKEKEKKSTETELRNTISVLEEQLADKNKTIKSLQLRVVDLKKTLQQELRTTSTGKFYSDIAAAPMNQSSAAILIPSQYTTILGHSSHNWRINGDGNAAGNDVNFTYLKHVIIKFLTSREYEAQHLIRAVSTLLQFTAEEEKLINDTLEWKMSWFGARPKINTGKSGGSSKSSGKTPRS